MADSKSNLIEFMQAFDRLIPMDSSANSSGVSPPNQIPTWAVKILEYTESAIHGFEDYCALRGFYARTSRGTNMAAKTDVLSSNTLRHSHVILYIPRGNLQTKLESHIYKSSPIDKITIVNIAEMNGVIGKLQEIEYEQCYVQQLEPMLDWLLVELKITKYNNTLYKYGTDGRLEGKDMATMDYTLNPKIDVHIYSNSLSEDEEEQFEQEESEDDDQEENETKGNQDGREQSEAGSDSDAQTQTNEESDDASSEDDLEKSSPDDDSQEDALDSSDDASDVEGSLPPDGEQALSAVKALAGGDKEALTQSAMSLLGIDTAQADQASKAKKLIAAMFNGSLGAALFGGLKKKGTDSAASGGDSADSSSGDAAGGDTSSADAASDGGDSGGAAGDTNNPTTSTDPAESGNTKKKKKSLLDDIVKKTDEAGNSTNNSSSAPK